MKLFDPWARKFCLSLSVTGTYMSKVSLTELTQTQLICQTDYLEKLSMIATCIKHEAKFRSLMTSSESVPEGNKARNQPNTGQTTVTNLDDMGKADSARICLTLPIVSSFHNKAESSSQVCRENFTILTRAAYMMY